MQVSAQTLGVHVWQKYDMIKDSPNWLIPVAYILVDGALFTHFNPCFMNMKC